MFKKIRRYLADPYYNIGYDMYRKCPRLMPDKYYVSIMWKMIMGYQLDLHHTRTFNEKLQWLKLYDHNPLYTQLVDKYRVKEWVAKRIGDDYVIPTLAVYRNVDEIDVSQLPDKFVLKCNHDSGSVVICEDKSKFDLNAAKKRLGEAMGENFYWRAREWPYKNVKRCIFAERFMVEDTASQGKQEIRLISEAEVIEVDMENLKWHRARVYGAQWDIIEKSIREIIDSDSQYDREITKNNLISLCKILGTEVSQISGELYYIKDGVMFGDLTVEDGESLKGFNPSNIGFQDSEQRKVSVKEKRELNGWIMKKNGYVIFLHSKLKIQEFSGLKDYKFFCFSGEPRIMYIANDSAAYPTMNFYDMDYSPLPLYTRDPPALIEPERPQNFEEMKLLAAKLSEGIPHVRVDFYENRGKVLFGEMTFFHMGGFSEVHPREWNLLMGDWIKLPRKRRIL
ncbi:MAG: hypothetical protein IKG81_02420 [Bacteroidales bacterium]|nr:hypothetical protein [Bacteroidales bacterium]